MNNAFDHFITEDTSSTDGLSVSSVTQSVTIPPKSFWKERLTKKDSSFGASRKKTTFIPEFPSRNLPKAVENWMGKDDFCVNHQRLNLESPLQGKLCGDTPGPSNYSPSSDYSVWARNPRSSSIALRHEEKILMITPSPCAYDVSLNLLNPKNVNRHPISDTMEVPGHRIRVGTVPGPNVYELCDLDKVRRNFKVDPQTKMPPRSPSLVRPRLHFSTLDVEEKYFGDTIVDPRLSMTPGPGQYRISQDTLTSSRSKSRTIGIKVPLMGQKEILPPGKTIYEIVPSFGEPGILSRPPSPFAFNRLEIEASLSTRGKLSPLTFCDKKAYGDYKSSYETKKPPNLRGKKGRVCESTVQNLTQYHKGRHAPGTYIKT